jgi:replication-associated recombination protein RarA
MAEIDGGALSFKSVMDNDQINTAIEETLRRVQGLSDGTVAGGKKMDAAFDATADNIRNALGQIGTACEMHEKELQNLESEYQRLGQKASAAFMAGRDEEYNANSSGGVNSCGKDTFGYARRMSPSNNGYCKV